MLLKKLKLKKKLNIPDFSVEWLNTTTSTNDLGKILGRKGKEGVIIADSQTKGRGRFERKFYSPSGLGLYMTIVVSPKDLKFSDCGLVTTSVALSVAKAIEKQIDLKCGIKWVNDIQINGKKICGILVESVPDDNGTIQSLVIGIGIDLYDGDYSETIKTIATNIEKESGVKISKEQLIYDIVYETLKLRNGLGNSFIKEYKERMVLIGEDVLVNKTNEIFEAKAVDVLEDGSLLVIHSGKEEIVKYGDVSVKKK